MASSFGIIVENQPDIDENIQIKVGQGLTVIHTINLTFKAARTQMGEVAIGSSNIQTAENIKNAINADYNNTGLYTFVRLLEDLTVTAVNDEFDFTEIANTGAPDITIYINNDAVTPFTIDNIVFSEAPSNPCDNVQLSITCSETADTIDTPVSAPVSSNPHVVSLARSSAVQTVTMTKDGTSGTATILIPKLLTSQFGVTVLTAPDGTGAAQITATLNVFYNDAADYNPLISLLQYSINDVDWSASPQFSGLTGGDYTMYVRDQLGCKIEIPFTVTGFEANLVDYDALTEISHLNALSFTRKVTIDGCSIFANPENLRSYLEESNYNHKNFKQIFQQCESTIPTQVRTTHETVTAKLYDCSGNETLLNVTKVTDNMDKTDVRDIKVLYRNGTNQVWFFCDEGNLYDPDTFADIGDYNTGGFAPSFVNVGDFVFLEGSGWAEIIEKEYVYLDVPGTYVEMFKTGMITAAGFYDDQEVIKGTFKYNTVDFNRFEFSVDVSALEGDYIVVVEMTDSTFEDAMFVSEWFNIEETQEQRHHVIDYYNSETNEILFETGIQFRLRLPNLEDLEFSPDLDQQIYVTDTNTSLGDNTGREFFKMSLMPLPTNMARKVVRALYCDRLKVDGLTYLLNGAPEVSKIKNTNLYKVQATLVLSDYIFENSRGISAEEILLPAGDPLQIDENSQGLLIVN